MILFGLPEVIAARCPQSQVHYVLQTTETTVARNDSYLLPLLRVLQQIEDAFSGPANPEQELDIGFFKLRIPAFPIDVVREGVLNAITHRDYSDSGEVLIRHTRLALVITSPGGFIGGITPRNILQHEPVSRNKALAEVFEKLRLVERAGVGRRRIFIPTLSYGKRAPTYEAEDRRVVLKLYDGGFDQRMARLVAKWNHEGREIELEGLLIISYLRDHAFIDTFSASDLLQLPRDSAKGVLDRLAQPMQGILERRGRTRAATYHLIKGVAKDLLGKASYTKSHGVDIIRFPEMVRAFLGDYGSITPQECRELLGLGESQSARVEVSRYLKRWSIGKDAFLRREGKPPKVEYFLREGDAQV